MILSRRLSGWLATIAAAIVIMAVPASAYGAVTVIVGQAGQGARTGGQPEATGSNPTTTTLNLCAGPTPTCPSTGYVNPGYTGAFTMSYGQDWNGTVIVTPSDNVGLTGQIEISWSYNGGPPTVICTLTYPAGGTCPSAAGTTEGTSVGTNTITATYEGDADHATSSSTVVITVVQDTTTATLTGSPNPQTAGQPVTLTATMTGSNAAPTGTVTFTYGGAVIGTATLVTPATGFVSTATMTTSALPVGSDTITATYNGTPDFAGASATWNETITPPVAGSFTLNVTPDPVNIGVGYGGILTVTVTPKNGFLQDVKLSCANVPQGATCLLVNPTIVGGSGSTQMIVQTTAPHSCGASAPYFLGRSGAAGTLLGPRGAPIAIPAMAGLLALCVPARRRRWLKLVVALAAALGVLQMSGCGNCTDLGTRPATYSIELTGTAQGGGGTPATVAQAVTVNVTI